MAEISQEEFIDDQPSWWRKPLLIIVGCSLLLLILSWSILDIFLPLIQSKTIQNNVLVFPNATIIFENQTLSRLQEEYLAHQNREIKACLFGIQNGSHYIIERVQFPDVVQANVVHIVSVPCPIDEIIDVHSHPINQCLASAQDVSVLKLLKQSNPSLRMMIMCATNRFALV